MKLLNYFNNFTTAIKTFPLSFFCLLVLTVLVIGDTEGFLDSFSNIEELGIATVLTLLLSLYGPLLSIYHPTGRSRKYLWINYGLQIGSILLGILYFILLVRCDFSDAITATQTLFLGIFPVAFIGIFLLIAILLKVAEEDIWLAYSNIIKSVAFGTLAGLIVRGGLSGALASIEALFDVDFSWKWYDYFGAFSMILLNGSFVLNYYLISTDTSTLILPSRIRKIFGSYIILPLAMIYLAIFIAYGVKILITGEWPRGVMVRLGCGYFTLGMICYYLTYPEKTTFFEVFHRILFASFLFIVWMMGCAILKRMNQYGLTFNRYLVCAFIISIAVFSILALGFQRKRLLSFVSVFFVAALVSFYAPYINASSMELLSQSSRLATLAENHDIEIPLTNDSLAVLTGNDARIAASMIDEIIDNHEKSTWSGNLIALENLSGDLKGYSLRTNVHELLGLDSYYPFYSLTEDKEQYFSFRVKEDEGIDIKGYSKFYEFSVYGSDISKNIVKLSDTMGGELDLTSYVNDIYEKSQSEDGANRGYFFIEQEGRKYMLYSMNGTKKSDGTITIDGVSGYLLVK